MDLTLREGISLNDAITQARQIDEQSKAAGFYQEAVDHIARRGFANARFETDIDEGLELLEKVNLSEVQGREYSHKYECVDELLENMQMTVKAVN